MKATNHFLAVVAALLSLNAVAQNSEERETVMYDPLFWKDELALRNTQSKKIEQINTEFYETLRQTKEEQASQSEMHEQLERELQTRSQKIYDTLLPKQRRKLEKIVDKTAPTITAP